MIFFLRSFQYVVKLKLYDYLNYIIIVQVILSIDQNGGKGTFVRYDQVIYLLYFKVSASKNISVNVLKNRLYMYSQNCVYVIEILYLSLCAHKPLGHSRSQIANDSHNG